ncbi:putative Fimh-like protein [Vibrio nigripulchritudo SOn1]|uniref:Fimh-like protein n=1 Tax=Vibrio nigripulchritudo SOn1 TaxID=1238450 RepID=A0AAV2VRS6_9VIBR|nr:DUF1566 domain-containing protein [Vibrio nigripulchritudo]CCO47260.1 putative Fimh-like protein [Vibrio nigripulchritudo SOn1]
MNLKWIAPVALMVSAAAGACEYQENLEATATANRFTLNADGTAVDNMTNLMWTRCTLGKEWDNTTSDCVKVGDVHHKWFEALESAEASTYAGYSDWRLPNIKELVSIVEVGCSRPAVNTTVFPSIHEKAKLWSSTPAQYYQSLIWQVDNIGDIGAVNRNNGPGSRVLFVREVVPVQ